MFTWEAYELTEISLHIMEHHLNMLSEVRPIKQKRRHFGPEKGKLIKVEVEKLLRVGHIREV